MMKKLLLFLFIILSFGANAQLIDSKFYQPITPPYSWKSGWFKNNLNIPKSEATNGRDTGAIYYKLADSSIYVWTGFQWRVISGGGGSNFANADLTFTGNRTHNASNYSLLIDSVFNFTANSIVGANIANLYVTEGTSAYLNVNTTSTYNEAGANTNRSFLQSYDAVSPNYLSSLFVNKDSIYILPYQGKINIDSLAISTDTTNFKPTSYNSITGQFRRMTSWPVSSGGGGGTQTLTDGATITFDASLGVSATVTLGGNRTLAFSNFSAGTYLTLVVIQDGTGSRTLTLPTCKVINGGAGAVTLTTAANSEDILTFFKIGTTIYCNYGKNYN